MIITDRGPGYGLHFGKTSCSMNSVNLSALIEPRYSLQAKYPSMDNAGRREKFSALPGDTLARITFPFVL